MDTSVCHEEVDGACGAVTVGLGQGLTSFKLHAVVSVGGEKVENKIKTTDKSNRKYDASSNYKVFRNVWITNLKLQEKQTLMKSNILNDILH